LQGTPPLQGESSHGDSGDSTAFYRTGGIRTSRHGACIPYPPPWRINAVTLILWLAGLLALGLLTLLLMVAFVFACDRV
jgi:hypothetical protein